MKLFLCSNLRLGESCTGNLSVPLSHQWAQKRNEKFGELLNAADREEAQCAVLAGRLFGTAHVPESLVDVLFDAVRAHEDLPVIACVNEPEYRRLTSRSDIPANLHLLTQEGEAVYSDGAVEVASAEEGILFRTSDISEAFLIKDVAGTFFDGAKRLPAFEPSGFEDASDGKYGYTLITTDGGGYITEAKGGPLFSYRTVTVESQPEDTAEDLMRMADRRLADTDENTFVRLVVTGATAFAETLDTEALKEHLQEKVFFAEVFDNTAMEVDRNALENDISLQSEFVRLVLQDESLSETERSRLISCGWNALNGKEVAGK